jgi:NADPH-dependent 2,4-dienoyl-CoA reductase/sulfur reductase-like enzyme
MTSGPGAAELLALRGVEAHIVLAGLDVGGALPYTNRRTLMDRLLALPLHWHFQSTLLRIDQKGKATLHVRGAGEVELEGTFDFVVQTA